MNRAASPVRAAVAVGLVLLLSCSAYHAWPLDRTPNPVLRKLYRFRHKDTPARCYTTNSNERFLFLRDGFSPEGVMGQVRTSQAPGTVPLYGITLPNGNEVLTTDDT